MTASSRYAAIIKRTRRKIQKLVEKGPTPGATMSIVTRDGPIWVEGFGYRSLARTELIDTDTIFQIGSTTKVFTGLSFMLAVQDGLVTLDDRLVDYWPEFTINSRHGEDEYRRITFRHLLSHRAGLPRDPRVGGIFGCEFPYTFNEMVESIKDQWMVATVNDRYYYSNVGMDAVAYALQRITRMAYPDWAREKIGKPLGMSTLRLGSIEALREENVAIGTEDGVNECEFAASLDYGCGDVWIGCNDLSKVLVLLLNEGLYEGNVVLESSLFQEMIRPHFSKEKGLNYGLGVDIYSGFTPLILGHGGGSIGYGSTFYWIPEYDFGVIVQTNMEGFTSDKENPHALGRDVREALLKANGATLYRRKQDDLLQEPTKAPEIKDLSLLAGYYAGLWNNMVHVDYRDGKLYWHSRFEMTPEGNGFRLPSGNAVRFNFRRKTSKHPYSATYVNPRYPVAELNVYRVQAVEPDPDAPRISEDAAKQIEGLYKATYYGAEPTFLIAMAKDGYLYTQLMTGIAPAYPHKSLPGLYFLPNGETITHDGNELWIEGIRGVKWDNPLDELRVLSKSNPTHRLLRRNTLSQIDSSLKILGRNREAKEVRALKANLYARK